MPERNYREERDEPTSSEISTSVLLGLMKQFINEYFDDLDEYDEPLEPLPCGIVDRDFLRGDLIDNAERFVHEGILPNRMKGPDCAR